MCDLAFLVDLMDHLNQLNLHLQGNGHLISTLVSHVKAFEMKPHLRIRQIERKDVTHFITLKTVANENLKYEKYSQKQKEVSLQFAVGEVFTEAEGSITAICSQRSIHRS